MEKEDIQQNKGIRFDELRYQDLLLLSPRQLKMKNSTMLLSKQIDYKELLDLIQN